MQPMTHAQDLIQEGDIAELFHEEQRTFSCHRYEKLNAFIKNIPEDELSEQIEAEIAGYKMLLQSEEVSFKERKIFRSQIRILKKILKHNSKKDGLKKFQQIICEGAQGTGKVLVRGLSWMANGIMVTAALPFQVIGKLTRGLLTGQVSEGHGEIHYDFIGPALYEGAGRSLLFSKQYLSIAATQPWIFPIIAAPVIDAEVMKVCKRKHSLRKEEVNYCKKFVNFKTSAMKLSTPFEVFGAKLNHLISKADSNEEQNETTYTSEEVLQDISEINDGNFCAQMMEIGKKFKNSKAQTDKKANLETWRIGTNPERYGQPDILDFNTPLDKLIRREESTRHTKLRNVVISLGPAQWQTQNINKKQMARDYRKNYKNLTRELKTARKIFLKADTIEQCQQLKQKYNFSYRNFEELVTSTDEDELGKRIFESQRIKRLFKSKTMAINIFNGTKLEWEFVEAGDIESINKIIRSKDIGNVILVIHGTEKGKIIDSNSNEIPRTFFNGLSPSIMSLNFFSCYSQKIDQYYGISKELSRGETYHPKRHLSFVEINSDYSYKKGQVPFESFPGFFSKLDFFLSKTARGNLLYESLSVSSPKEVISNKCELHIYNMGQEKSTFSVTINNIHVGSVTGSRDKSRFEFDCDVLKNENSLRLLSINLNHQEPLTLDKTQIYLIHPTYFKELSHDDLRPIKLKNDILGITASFWAINE
jgi:hypothetical protein